MIVLNVDTSYTLFNMGSLFFGRTVSYSRVIHGFSGFTECIL